MLSIFNKNLRRLCSKFRWPVRRRAKPKVIIKRFGKSNSRTQDLSNTNGSATIHPNNHLGKSETPIRIATFNAALFSMAPAVPELTEKASSFDYGEDEQDYSSKLHEQFRNCIKTAEIRKIKAKSFNQFTGQRDLTEAKWAVKLRHRRNGRRPEFKNYFPSKESENQRGKGYRSTKTVLEVLKELDADILALQDVKAEEEKDMKPLSDLAAALGMNYVFAESWAPEYGNAVLSKWPIKRSKVQKIFDDSDFRNVLKATIDVPQTGEVDFHCTLLDHLDEKWRMKQINAIIESNERPHILAGGINSLDETDYSPERWTDIVKYYEEMGKPTPKVEVMKYLKNKQYTDAKDFAGEYESVVIIAKGQNVQGTCKYGTRVDYLLVSPDSPYKFVPGSYMVLSSKGTSDHHIVKVDVTKVEVPPPQQYVRSRHHRHSKQKVVKITNSNSSKGVWKMQTLDRS
ncbi:unnamed protein product [Lactuca virosa]|uniref:Endonuclease/exonuclease/phosphatase domain-containing protein n=1 Tax=Lactuca virosa TaxID=75947 RepID=A0AAU9MGG9_9ASTR|nr:unnamed protein product [Lactuca virosa]